MDPVDLKNQGNTHFKAGRFTEASKLYAQAEKGAPTDPVYPSNLSAALFEAGDYTACFLASLRSLKLLLAEDGRNGALLDRLSIRLARTLRSGLRSGRLSHRFLQAEDASKTIAQLKELSEGSENDELLRAWSEWRQTESEFEKIIEGVTDARARLARLPIYKARPMAIMEYYSISHDNPISIIHDYGTEDKHPSPPLKLSTFSGERLSKLAFLFGGVGDGRHVFASIIGLHQTYKTLSKTKQAKFRVHFTLLDIHPTALSRDLIVLLLLDSLLNDTPGVEETAEIKATLFYVYTAMVVPAYCYHRFMKLVKSLRERLSSPSPTLPSWIHLVSESIPSIITSLDYWIANCPNKTTGIMLEHFSDEKYRASRADIKQAAAAGVFPGYAAHNPLAERDLAARRSLDQQSDADIIKLGLNLTNPDGSPPVVPTDPAGRAAFIEKTKERVVEMMGELEHGTLEAKIIEEKTLYKKVRGFIPPKELWKRHTAMAGAWKLARAFKSGGSVDDSRAARLGELGAQAQAEVRDTWKPNPSLFDAWLDHTSGYPAKHTSGFDPVLAFESFNERMGMGGVLPRNDVLDSPSFSITWVFFGAVLEALKDMKDHIQLEVLRGELNQELLKMRTSGDQHRPAHFPRTFTRMWLSNVPDYTHGPFNTAVYVVPSLQSDADCSVGSNCLLNPPIWRDDDEFAYTYSLLRVRDIPRYFGCRVLKMSPVWDLTKLAANPLPRPLNDLATRPELTAWLTRVFFSIILPGKTHEFGMRTYVRYPNSLAAFVELLVHLHSVGYPTHWLSDFVSIMLTDTLTTDIALYQGKYPCSSSEMTRRVARRKVCLDPWLVDLENILATSYEAIPFLFAAPGFATSSNEIGLYETTLDRLSLHPSTITGRRPPDIAVVSLMFYKPGSFSDEYLVTNLPQILEGKKLVVQGELFVLTCVERFSVWDRVVRWRMSKKRVRKMKMQKWVMVSYRFDANEIVSRQNEARYWKEIADE